MNKAVFLDRDGTILNERGYLSDPQKMKFYSFSFPALKKLQRAGFKLVLITNQSGIGRGYFTEKRLHEIHREFNKKCRKKGVRISKIYYCPHKPKGGCSCRKPSPFLMKKAARELKINLRSSYMVGDQDRDVKMALRAKVKSVLVLTGAGRRFQMKFRNRVDKVTSNLLTAAKYIVQDRNGF